METYWTNFWSFFTNMNVTTITANPNSNSSFCKYLSCFNIFCKFTITFFMFFFYFCNTFKLFCNIFKPFFTCNFCKLSIHISPLIIFSFSSRPVCRMEKPAT